MISTPYTLPARHPQQLISATGQRDVHAGGGGGVGTMSGGMHQAPSLSQAPPAGNTLSDQHGLHAFASRTQSPSQSLRSSLLEGYSPGHGTGREVLRQGRSVSPPLRKDTRCSTSTNATTATNASQPSIETGATTHSTASSPTAFSSQNVFAVSDGSDVNSRKQKRRRTGPLTTEQRTRAALIRKHGACSTCHNRRVACDPSHHNLTWDDLQRRYGAVSPDHQAPPAPVRQPSTSASPRGWRPMNAGHKRNSDEMDVEIEPLPSPLSEAATMKGRKPLPAGPRLVGTAQAALSSLVSPERLRADLPGLVTRTYTLADCGRYSSVEALLLYWADDHHHGVASIVNELQQVLRLQYNHACVVDTIPPLPDPSDSYRWLSDRIRSFTRQSDQRDVLKIFYYNGHAYLDGNRQMVLASSTRSNEAIEIRWNPIQADLEESLTDTLIIMDCPYLGDKISKRRGILEVLAANSHDDYASSPVPRCAFTMALVEKLRTHANQSPSSPRDPLCATDLHAHIMSEYPKIIKDTRSDDEIIKNLPSPSHVLARARGTVATSIELRPLLRSPVPGPDLAVMRQVTISLQLSSGENADEGLREWLRLAPNAVGQIRVEERRAVSAAAQDCS